MNLSLSQLGSIVVAGMLSVGNANGGSQCDFQGTGDPSMTQKLQAKISSTISEAQKTVVRILAEPPASSGRMKAGYSFYNTWECNYALIHSLDLNQPLYTTAKHCVSNNFSTTKSDIWSNPDIYKSEAKIRITHAPEKILTLGNIPEYGETVEILGCTSSLFSCYSITGKWRTLYKNNQTLIEGIWISLDDMQKIFAKQDGSTAGLSGAPVLNAQGEIFGVVSGIAQAGFKYDEKGKCVAHYNGIAIALIKNPSNEKTSPTY